jgi:hypothetical protein
MKKLNRKAGLNDITIMGTLIAIFFFIGVLLPYVTNDLESDRDINADVDDFISDVDEKGEGASSLNAFQILLSIGKMFIWTFGDLPFWLDMIFVFFRIIFWVTLARNIWIGGGS